MNFPRRFAFISNIQLQICRQHSSQYYLVIFGRSSHKIDICLRNRFCFYAIFPSLIRSTAASATLQTKENQTEEKVVFHFESRINVPQKYILYYICHKLYWTFVVTNILFKEGMDRKNKRDCHWIFVFRLVMR